METLQATGPLPGFEVVEPDSILPEIVDVGEYREEASYRSRLHTQNHWLVFYVVEGSSQVGLEAGPEIWLKPGSVACLPPNLSYWRRHGPESKHRLLRVGFQLSAIDDRYPEWKLSHSLDQFRFAHDVMHLERFFLQVIQEAVTPSLLQTCGLRLALDTLLLEVVRGIPDPEIALSPLSVHPAVSKALEILQTRFKKNWTLSELAQDVGLSRSRLAELFNLETGYSIRKFLTRIRLQYAETLLNHSDLPIGDIAAECGFATIQHFSRVFKQTHGRAPIDFRRRYDAGDLESLAASAR
jgi:AraC-like DNA-binding protein